MKRSKRPAAHASEDRSAAIDLALRAWFRGAARPLPWRTTPRDPYGSLVSEIMLQQTQVSRVIVQFQRFMERFPTVRTLAAAEEHEVLALWSGMGYYQRARNLHAAAKQICAEFRGQVPPAAADLRTLKGVGRYTAGAIASIVYGRPEPIVDGNVARVLMRLDGKPFAHGSADGMAWAWSRAAAVIARTPDPAAFNEGLMELGATVCTPRSPSCDACPLRGHCIARAKNRQDKIPGPKPETARKVIYCAAAILTDSRGRILLERRPPRGMWAGLWQAPTLEGTAPIDAAAFRAALGVRTLKPGGEFTHTTTHRELLFRVYTGRLPVRVSEILEHRLLAARADLDTLALGTAQRSAILLGLDGPRKNGPVNLASPPARAALRAPRR